MNLAGLDVFVGDTLSTMYYGKQPPGGEGLF